jgi:hypothetical protein
MKEKKESGLKIEELEQRIAPRVLANPHALPPDNPGTSNALDRAPADAKAAFTPLWFGKAAGR